MGGVAWGTLFPNMTLLTIIGTSHLAFVEREVLTPVSPSALTYSIIAPLVVGFAAFGFLLFWFVYKYAFLYCYDVPSASETGGLFYPKALSHILCVPPS